VASRSAERDPAPRKTEPALTRLAGYFSGAKERDAARLIYDRVRLAIMSALAVEPVRSFTELRRLLDTSDGNLSTHLKKLEGARFVSCRKYFEGRVPRTEYRLTSKGKKAFTHYLDHMEALIRTTRKR
jgi:DNA-binding HxlR family transcriptional regulator